VLASAFADDLLDDDDHWTDGHHSWTSPDASGPFGIRDSGYGVGACVGRVADLTTTLAGRNTSHYSTSSQSIILSQAHGGRLATVNRLAYQQCIRTEEEDLCLLYHQAA